MFCYSKTNHKLCAFCQRKLTKILTILCFSFAISAFYHLTKRHMEDSIGLQNELKFEDNDTDVIAGRLCEPRLEHGKFHVFEKDQNQTAIEQSVEEYSHTFYEMGNKLIKSGGFFEPTNCTSSSNIAIIIPYRQREHHLHILLAHLHTLLQKQLVSYGIFVAEQLGDGMFNKGILMNSAFKWVRAKFDGRFDCFIFHDVDLISEMTHNIYKCGGQPIHLSPAVSKLDYKLPYKELIGGVLAFRPDQFVKINGYSNVYWGWGGEDDDMYKRLKIGGMVVQRPPLEVGRYFMMRHEKRTWISHANTYKLLGKSYSRMKSDGLKDVKVEKMLIQPEAYCTKILLEIKSDQ